MATNELTTRFIFDDRDGIKVDNVRNKLIGANDSINNFGKGSLIGKNIADAIKPAENALDSLKNKVTDSASKPTISRYWEAEGQKTVNSLKSIENAVIKTNNSLSNLSSPSLKTLPEIGGKNIIQQPEVKFKIDDKSFIDLDRLQKKADDTRSAFADISAQRINSGQIGSLTKEIVTAHERSKQLAGDIRNIKTELASPNRKSSIRFLTDELIAAEREADSLNRKLNSLPAGSGGGAAGRGGAKNLKLSSFQKTNLSYQVNDVLTGLASGQNPAQILAQQGGQIAQIFSPAQASALVAAYAPMVGILGAGAAALALTYKITGDIRAEAEKRLKIETMISAAGNKQALAQKQALNDFIQLRKESENSRNFSDSLQTGTVDGLKNRRATLEKMVDIDSTSDQSKIFQNQIIQIDAQLKTIEERNKSIADAAFGNRWESWKKSQESAIESQRKSQQAAIEMEKKFQAEVEKGKNKVIELGKISKSALDELYQRKNADNPFVQVFSEANNSLQTLRDNLKGLPQDLQNAAIASQQAINKNKLFETRVDNNLSILDLKETADKFRNPNRAEDNKQFFDSAVNGDISRGKFFPNFGGTYGSYLANKVGGAENLTDGQRRDIYEVGQLKNLSGNPKFESVLDGNVNDRSLISRLASERLNGFDQNLSVNDRLQKQIGIINSDVGNESEKAIADRKLLAIGSNLDPSQIYSDLRNQIASAAEREAERKSNFEQKGYELERQKIQTQEKLIEALNKLTRVAEKEGLQGVNKAVEVIIRDEMRYGSVDTGASGTMYDVAENYEMNPRRPNNRDTARLYGND